MWNVNSNGNYNNNNASNSNGIRPALMESEIILQSFGAWDAHAAYGDTHELRAKYAKKVEAIIGEPVEIHRKLNGNRAVRDKRRLRQCRNLYKKQHQNRETEKSGSFSYAQRPTDVPPWADS